MSDKDLTDFDPLELTGKAGERAELMVKREHAKLEEIAKRNGWPVRLPFDLALQMEPAEDTFAEHGVGKEDALALMAHKEFVASVKAWQEAIVKEGYSFKLKAKLIAEDLLDNARMLATNPDVAHSVRAQMTQWFTKIAGYEPNTKNPEGGGGQGAGFKLVINFAGNPRPAVIEGTAERIEEE